MNFDIKHTEGDAIPARTREALARYILQRIKPGGGLTAILGNELADAAFRCDKDVRDSFATICCFLYWEAPDACHGSPAKVKAWLAGREGMDDE